MAKVKHYMKSGRLECIDVIEQMLTPEEYRGFLKGNAIKYLYRAGDKGPSEEDLRKANDYTCRLSTGMWLTDYADDLKSAPAGQFCYDSTK